MVRGISYTFAAVLVAVSIAIGSMSAEGAWRLWVESPEGSDLWSVVRIGQVRFESGEECQRRAQDMGDLEAAFAKMQGAEAHDVFACFPETVDPRPEGALRLDIVNPPGPRKAE